MIRADQADLKRIKFDPFYTSRRESTVDDRLSKDIDDIFQVEDSEVAAIRRRKNMFRRGEEAKQAQMNAMLTSTQQTDLIMERINPRHIIAPEDWSTIDQIPDFEPKVPETSGWLDDVLHNQEDLVKHGRASYAREEGKYSATYSSHSDRQEDYLTELVNQMEAGQSIPSDQDVANTDAVMQSKNLLYIDNPAGIGSIA
jgi:hypothetical protein